MTNDTLPPGIGSEIEAGTSNGEPPAKRDSTRARKTSKRTLLVMYRQILVTIFSATIVSILLLLAIFYPIIISPEGDSPAPSIMIIVIVAGVMGALFSFLVRLYRYEDLPAAMVEEDLRGLSPSHRLVYSLVPLAVGAIAACVLYIIFAGKLIEGPFFPKFACVPEKDCKTFAGLLHSWVPEHSTEYAKVIIWGFIAGFAERLVPDTLANFSKKVEIEKTNQTLA